MNIAKLPELSGQMIALTRSTASVKYAIMVEPSSAPPIPSRIAGGNRVAAFTFVLNPRWANCLNYWFGRVAEWFKAPVLKECRHCYG